MSNNANLERLLIALDDCGVKKYGRNPQVADKTGYAAGMVAKVLSGNAALTDRFIQAVCSGFGIRKEWVERGEKPILKGFDLSSIQLTNEEKKRVDEGIQARSAKNYIQVMDDLKRQSIEMIYTLLPYLPAEDVMRIRFEIEEKLGLYQNNQDTGSTD